MFRRSCYPMMAFALVIGAVPAEAQPAAPPAGRSVELRQQIETMEGVLNAAAKYAARRTGPVDAMADAEPFLISTGLGARGFYVEGIGMVFDVPLPRVRQSVLWTWQDSDRNRLSATFRALDTTMKQALRAMRQMMERSRNAALRKELAETMQQIEAQLPELSGERRPGAASAGVSALAIPEDEESPAKAGTPPPAAKRMPIAPPPDPTTQYLQGLRESLVRALLEHGGALTLTRPDDWITVVAKPGATMFLTDDETAPTTLVLKIKRRDLDELRAGSIGREEARRRVQISEY